MGSVMNCKQVAAVKYYLINTHTKLKNAVFKVKSHKNTLDRLVRKMLLKKNQNVCSSLKKGLFHIEHEYCTKRSTCHSH